MPTPAFPHSGRTGYLKYGFPVYEEPIYRWTYLTGGKPVAYANSEFIGKVQHSPVGHYRTLTITGVNYVPDILTDYLTTPAEQLFEIGYVDTFASVRRAMTFRGVISDITLNFFYGQQVTPSFYWTATWISTRTPPIYSTQAWPPVEDQMVCVDAPLCSLPVQSSNTLQPIVNVRQATLRITYEIIQNYLSNSLNEGVCSVGNRIDEVSIVLQTDFVYWMQLYDSAQPYDYLFYYGTSPSDYWRFNSMFVHSISDFTCNIETGEILALTAELIND